MEIPEYEQSLAAKSDAVFSGSSSDTILLEYERPMNESNRYFLSIPELRIAQGARDKYDENGCARYFPGISVVTWIEEDTRLFMQLSNFTEELKAEVKAKGLLPYLAFLPSETFHMTVADVAVWPPTDITDAVVGEAGNAFEAVGWKQIPPVKMYAAGVSISGATSIVLRIHPETREDLCLAQYLRDELFSRFQPLGVGSNGVFIGHITLAYIVRDIPRSDYPELQEILRRHERRFVGALRVTRVDLRRFENMEQWSRPLAAVTLGAQSE